MKKLIYILALLAVTLSCGGNKQQKAEKLVKEHILSLLPDPGSYEALRFEAIEPVYTRIEHLPDYQEWQWARNSLIELHEKAMEMSEVTDGNERQQWLSEARESKDSADYYQTLLDAAAGQFESELAGYRINHVFRSKSASGTLLTEAFDFYIDPGFENVFIYPEILIRPLMEKYEGIGDNIK